MRPRHYGEVSPHPASWWESREVSGPTPLPLVGRKHAGPHERDLEREREQRRVLGLDVGRHPLSPHLERLSSLGVVPTDEVLDLPHGTRARAAGLRESLQSPPTRSGKPVWFLQVEDQRGLLQATVFERLFRESGHILYQTSAFLLEGRVEQDPRRGFSFVVERIADLAKAIESAESRAVGRSRSGKARKAG